MMRSHHFLDLKKHEVIASIPEGSSAPVPFLAMTLAPLKYEAGRKDAIIALSVSAMHGRVQRWSPASESCSLTLRQEKARVTAGVALREFRQHTTGPWGFEQHHQASSRLHPIARWMGCARHVGCVCGITGHQSLYCPHCIAAFAVDNHWVCHCVGRLKTKVSLRNRARGQNLPRSATKQ